VQVGRIGRIRCPRVVDLRAGRHFVEIRQGQRRLDSHGQAYGLPEGLRERILQPRPELGLELGPGEVVADGDDRGVAVQRHRLALRQPDPMVGRQLLAQPVEHLSPRCTKRLRFRDHRATPVSSGGSDPPARLRIAAAHMNTRGFTVAAAGRPADVHRSFHRLCKVSVDDTRWLILGSRPPLGLTRRERVDGNKFTMRASSRRPPSNAHHGRLAT
jgi:hypothetical protein